MLASFSGCAEDDPASPAGNSAPNAPSNPVPADQAANQSIFADIAWTCTDPDGDPLTYDVYFGAASTPPQMSTSQSTANYDPGTLSVSQVYYWRIVVRDDHGNETAGPTWSFGTTGATGSLDSMVLVSAGEFTMGRSGVATPEHQVYLDAYYIDIYEVTNSQYRAFCDATSRAYPPDPNYYTNYFTNPTFATFPVVNVTWQDAVDYAAWAGKRLPTEAEWERAAKGDADNRLYPWGDAWVNGNANLGGDLDDYTYTSPVGSFPSGISPARCYDMTGNVMEWCHDYYAPYTADYQVNPQGPSTGSPRIVRGGSWMVGYTYASCAYRGYADSHRSFITGFRCARTP